MADETGLELDAPKPLAAVAPEAAAGLVPLADEVRQELEKRVDGFVEALVRADSDSPEFGREVDRLANLGQRQIEEAAGHSSRFLDRPLRAMDRESGVSASLAQLRRTVEELDPARHGRLAPGGLLRFLPWGNRARRYFDRYKSAESQLSAILKSLSAGRDELLHDNAAIDTERNALFESMGRLSQMVHMSRLLDARLEQAAAGLAASDPAKAKSIRETALFHARQRSTDLLTQLAVSVQGYLALDLVKKSNLELLKGVDRASTTTVAALRTAVTVSEALSGQKLVLDQVAAVNSTTAGLIQATSEMLKQQTARIHEQAASATIPVEVLQTAFRNIYDSMDAVDRFKERALDSMQATVNALGGEVEKAKARLARAGSAGSHASLADSASGGAALSDLSPV